MSGHRLPAAVAPPRGDILLGDALSLLRTLPDHSIDCVVSSPPYYALRNYAATGQLGMEANVDEWVDTLAAVSGEVQRILVPTGTFWLNLGDTYASHPRHGAPRKSLLLAPERLALRLQRDGWIIRNKIVWAKPNPVPTSVTDRLNTTYELIYVLACQPRYFFDLDAIREPHRTTPKTAAPLQRPDYQGDPWRGPNSMTATGLASLKAQGRVGHPLGKNPGDVWTITPGGYRSSHHAAFPVALAERMIAAGCPEARCIRCRLPWRRRVVRRTATRSTLLPTCTCQAASEAGLVLDPFMGSGTTAVAAENLGRDWLGIELNAEFAADARERITKSRAARSLRNREAAA